MKALPPFARLMAVAALALAAGLAQAQYVWIDAKGNKQFSDRSPPASIPDKNILKAPGRQVLAVLPAEEEEQLDPAPITEAARKAPPTVADKNIEFNKRISDKAEAAKKAGAEAQAKAAKAEQCTAAREYKVQLDSGARIATVTPGGEPAFMSDAERAAANAKAARMLAACR